MRFTPETFKLCDFCGENRHQQYVVYDRDPPKVLNICRGCPRRPAANYDYRGKPRYEVLPAKYRGRLGTR